MGELDAAQQREQGFRLVVVVVFLMAQTIFCRMIPRMAQQREGGEAGIIIIMMAAGWWRVVIIAVRVQSRTENFPAKERDVQGARVQWDQGVSGRLVHVAVGVGDRGGGGRGGGGSGRVQVGKSDDAVVMREAVEQGQEGVFASRDEGDNMVGGRGHGGSG